MARECSMRHRPSRFLFSGRRRNAPRRDSLSRLAVDPQGHSLHPQLRHDQRVLDQPGHHGHGAVLVEAWRLPGHGQFLVPELCHVLAGDTPKSWILSCLYWQVAHGGVRADRKVSDDCAKMSLPNRELTPAAYICTFLSGKNWKKSAGTSWMSCCGASNSKNKPIATLNKPIIIKMVCTKEVIETAHIPP